MPQAIKAEIYFVVDANGGYGYGIDIDGAKDKYKEDVGELEESEGFRVVCVEVEIAPPELTQLQARATAPKLPEPSAS